MKSRKLFVTYLMIVSLLVGLVSGTIKFLIDEANRPEPVITVEDYRQQLRNDVSKLDYSVKSNPIEGATPDGVTLEKQGDETIALFLIDTSGSMQTKYEDKLTNTKNAISDSFKYIGTNSYVGMISYSTEVVVNVPIAKFDAEQVKKLNGELYNLKAVGGTHMYEAIAIGMQLIEDELYEHPNAKAMIFVVSDGVPSDDAKKLDFVEKYVRGLSIPIHTIGYGIDIDREELKKVALINEATYTFVNSDNVNEEIQRLIENSF